MGQMSSDRGEYTPSYRQRDVDTTLNDHEGRIKRLEKVALVGVGYALSDGGSIATTIVQFL